MLKLEKVKLKKATRGFDLWRVSHDCDQFGRWVRDHVFTSLKTAVVHLYARHRLKAYSTSSGIVFRIMSKMKFMEAFVRGCFIMKHNKVPRFPLEGSSGVVKGNLESLPGSGHCVPGSVDLCAQRHQVQFLGKPISLENTRFLGS